MQIEGPTLANKYGFKYDTASPGVQQKETSDHLTILSVEVHVNARGDFLPDPAHDAISAIFFCIQETDPFNEGGKTCYSSGCLMVSDHIASDRFMPGMEGFQIELCADEQALLDRLIDSVIALDPDILLGYEIHNGSWGYIIERAAKAFRMLVETETNVTSPY